MARWTWLFRGAPAGAWGLSDDRAQAGLQTPHFKAWPLGGGGGSHSQPAGVTAHFFRSTTLSAVSPDYMPHALSRRTCGLTGGGSPTEGVQVCACRLLTDDRAELQVTVTSDRCALSSSLSLAASSFSFLTSLSARCPDPHPRFLDPLPGKLLLLLGDHIKKQKWVHWTKS